MLGRAGWRRGRGQLKVCGGSGWRGPPLAVSKVGTGTGFILSAHLSDRKLKATLTWQGPRFLRLSFPHPSSDRVRSTRKGEDRGARIYARVPQTWPQAHPLPMAGAEVPRVGPPTPRRKDSGQPSLTFPCGWHHFEWCVPWAEAHMILPLPPFLPGCPLFDPHSLCPGWRAREEASQACDLSTQEADAGVTLGV